MLPSLAGLELGREAAPTGVAYTRSGRREIEALIERDMSGCLAGPDDVGRAKRLEDASGRYVEYIKNIFSNNFIRIITTQIS